MNHIEPDDLALLGLGEQVPTPQQEAHLGECEDCSDALERLTRVVLTARLAGPDPLPAPPKTVWSRIAQETGMEGRAEPAADAPTDPGRRPRRPRRATGRAKAGVLGLVSGLVLGAAAVAGIWQVDTHGTATTTAAIALHPLPQFPQWVGADGTAELRTSQGAETLEVSVHGVAGPGFLEVWLLGRDGVSMISLGDLGATQAGSFTIPPGTDLRFYSRVDISLQPFDGSTQHTKSSVVRGTIPTPAAS